MKRIAMVAVLGFCASSRANENTCEGDKEQAAVHYRQAAKQYGLAHYGVAASEFEAAYDKCPAAAFLFNMAQAYRLAKDAEKAATYYHQYISAAPDGTHVVEAQAYIQSLALVVEEQQKARAAAAAQAQKEAPPSPPTLPPPAPAPSTPSQGHGARRGAGLALAISGALIAIGGGVLIGVSASSYSSATSATNEGQYSDQLDSAASERIAGAVLLGVGAAALAAGVVILVLPNREPQHAISIRPSLGGVAFGCSF